MVNGIWMNSFPYKVIVRSSIQWCERNIGKGIYIGKWIRIGNESWPDDIEYVWNVDDGYITYFFKNNDNAVKFKLVCG